MTTEPYIYRFEYLSQKLSDKSKKDERQKKLKKFSDELFSVWLLLDSAIPCAKLLMRLNPDKTEFTEKYYKLLSQAQKTVNLYHKYFGNNLESLSQIESTDALIANLIPLNEGGENIRTHVALLNKNVFDYIDSIKKKYDKAKKSQLELEEINEGIFRDVSEYTQNFKSIDILSKKLKSDGIDSVYNTSRDLQLQLNELNNKLDEIISNAPILSAEAQDFIDKLDSGRRILLRDIDVDLIREIQNKLPNIGNKYALKLV